MKTIIDVNGVRTENGPNELDIQLDLKVHSKSLDDLLTNLVEEKVRAILAKFDIAGTIKHEIKKELEKDLLTLSQKIDELKKPEEAPKKKGPSLKE